MKITIRKYDDSWPEEYRRIRLDLENTIGFLNPIIEHIGSTAVPGMMAKPVIDIMIGVRDLMDLDKVVKPLCSQNYIYLKTFEDQVPNHRLFVGLKDKDAYAYFDPIYTDFNAVPHDELQKKRISHVHIWPFESHDWQRHLAVRDFLRQDAESRHAYSKIKHDISQKSWQDGMAYNRAKNKFVCNLELRAMDWYFGSSGHEQPGKSGKK